MTWAVGAANVAVFLLEEAAGGSQRIDVLLSLGAQATPLLEAGQWWRMVTATFLHIGVIHLAANLWALALFGPLLERLLGSSRYAATYLASGIAGSAASALFGPEGAVSAGASGAIFGLLGGFAVVGLRLRENPVGQAWLRQAVVLVVLNVALGLSVPQIGLEAHLGGLAGGAVVVAAETVGRVRGGRLAVGRRSGPLRWSGLAAAAVVAAASSGATVAVLG